MSRTQAKLHFPRIGSPRRASVVPAIMLCGGVVLLALGVLGVVKAQLDNDDSLPTGDLRAIITPAGHDEAIPAATITPAGHGGAIPTATPTPLPEVAAPTRMVIEKMGVDAPIITLGLDENFVPQVPSGPYEVAWYDWSSKPSQGSNAVFAGHVDWTVNGRPVAAVFWGLGDLQEGDMVKLFLEDGSELQYRVTQSVATEHDDRDGAKFMDKTPNDVITLITCGGTWIPDGSTPLGGNYTHRVFVRAERVTQPFTADALSRAISYHRFRTGLD